MHCIIHRALTAQSPIQRKLLALGLFACALSLGSSAHAVNDVWDANGANPPYGFWGTATNWGDNTVPGNSDSATFNLASTYTVSFDVFPFAIQELTMTTGNVTFSNVGGTFIRLNVSSSAGGGEQDILLNGAALTIGTPATGSMGLHAGDDLTVQNGSTLSVANGGSQISATDLVTVGAAAGSGSGTINIDNAEFLTGAGAVTINPTGAINVTGYGNFLANGNVTINGGMLICGANGSFILATGKTLTIQNGGRAAFGGNHNVWTDTTVTGAGSRFDFDASVYMNAAVNVLAGADVYSENGVTIGANSIGSGTIATLTIDGSGSSVTSRSTLTVGHSSIGSAVVNVNNNGTLSVLEEATVLNPTGTINIASGTANLGTLIDNGGTINFTSGCLSYGGLLTVGPAGLMGQSITLFANRQLTVSATTIEPLSFLNLNGGTLNTALEVRGTLNVFGTGGTLAGSVSVEGNGIVNAFQSIVVPIFGNSSSGTINVNNGLNISLGSAASFTGFNHRGTLSIGASMVTLNSAGYAGLGVLTTLASGTINAPNGVFISGGGTFLGNGAVNTRITGDSGALIEANGALGLGDAASPAGFNFAGELRVRQHTVTLFSSNQAALGNLTTLGYEADGVANAGTLNATNGLVVDFGDAITGYGTVSSTNTLAKRTVINGTAQGSSPGQPLTFTGYVKGVGTFNNVIFTGTFDPGLSPAILTVGNLGFSSTNTLIMELGGTAPGSGHDQIQSSGTLAVDGTLQISLINRFNPVLGNSFNLFDWTGLAGTFDTLQLPALSGSLVWDTTQLYTTGMLLVAAPGFPGDYNQDGTVDAADYVVWRKAGINGPTGYDTWRINFGQPAGSGAALPSAEPLSAAVPEPTTLVMLIVAAVGIRLRRRQIAD